MAAKAKPEWYNDKTTIKLPKAPKGEENFVIASVNGYVVKIQRGVEVEVPKAIAEAIEQTERDLEMIEQREAEMTSR